MAVKVQFQIGHTSKLRSKKTVEGFTHDWELYVKGVQQADISAFVEKIIFNLHESFQKPKRVCSKPPYVIQESGYAGFIVFIDIYFRNRDEPKKVQFNYDLDLQQTGPPQHRHDVKTFIFDNPSEEYRQKLLKGGGVPVSGVVAGSQPTINNNMATISNVANLIHSPGEGHRPLLTESKKHKSRLDDPRSNAFSTLFGPPLTKTSSTVATKHSPDNKIAVFAAHASHQTSAGTSLPAVVKEKSSRDKDKSSEKSKERSEKREKHHKQSVTSPHKEGRSESKKSDGSKHEKRDKTEEKSKKDKNRDKDRERDRDKTSGANINNSSNNNKKPASPKPVREHSPHKSTATGIVPTNSTVNNTNSVPRPSSSNSGKLEDLKTSSKSSKDLQVENKPKESKQKESSSSSSGKKSKKEKKDKDKERDKEKRHEEREKQKLTENTLKSSAKEDINKVSNNSNTHTNNANSLENKNSKSITTNQLNSNVTNDLSKKPEKLLKQDLLKASNDKVAINNTGFAPPVITANSSTEKKTSSNSSLNSNSNPSEKDKRSHKHKKKEKNKDKDKDRERDKERDKDKDKEKEKEKEKDKEKERDKDTKREKETKEKQPEEKVSDAVSSNPENSNIAKALFIQTVNTLEDQQSNTTNQLVTSTTTPTNITSYATTTTTPSSATALATTTTMPSSSSSATSNKSSKNKDKKSKDKSSIKEEKLKRKLNDIDATDSKGKQDKLSNINSVNTSSSLSTSSSSFSTPIANSLNSTQPAAKPAANSSAVGNLNLDLSDADSLATVSMEQMTALPNNSTTKPVLQEPSPIITHSEGSNSSFPELQPPKQQPTSKSVPPRERSKSFNNPAAGAPPPTPTPTLNPAPKETPKAAKTAAKEKPIEKPSKEEEKEKKKRRNSQAANTFIEPPVKQLKTKEPKPTREKSKSPLLRNAGPRASISTEASNTFLQPSVSPSSTAAAAPLPPPSSAPLASHSPALSATEAVGNATSATANAATCNSNSTQSSVTNSTDMAAPHQLPLDYLSELQELHHKIMTLQDSEDLQHVVELIAATGCFEITTKTFDFDLCRLDRATIQKLQEFFANSVS